MPDSPIERCADVSIARAESTAGTLGYFDIGVFIEGFRPFPRLAVNSLLPELHERNMGWWDRYRESGQGMHPRMLPIRDGRSTAGGVIRVFVLLPRMGAAPLQLRFDLSDYRDLLDFDFKAMKEQPDDYAAYQDDTPRVIVCAHGKVDPCCALRGNAVFKSLSERGDLEVWHGAHFGGCRFAANVWFLPSGNCYGHVTPETAAEVVAAEARAEVHSTGFRGRIGDSMVTSAAEQALRERFGAWSFDAIKVVSVQASADGQYLVNTATPDGRTDYRLRVTPTVDQRFLTCRAETPQPTMEYTLLAHE